MTDNDKLPEMAVKQNGFYESHAYAKRKEKRYYREITLGVELLMRDWPAVGRTSDVLSFGGVKESVDSHIRSAVTAALIDLATTFVDSKEIDISRSFKLQTNASRPNYNKVASNSYQYSTLYYTTVFFNASGTKTLPQLTEDHCLRILDDRVAPRMRAAIEQALVDIEQARQTEERARIANLILASYIDDVDKEARLATRYKQRLAALNAEYKAELDIQAAKLLDKLGDSCGIVWADDAEFEPDKRSVVAAKAKLKAEVAKLGSPTSRDNRLLRMNNERPVIQPEDVQ